MISHELIALQKHIKQNANINVELRDTDPSPDQYPLVQILTDQPGELFKQTDQMFTINLPVRIKIIVDKKNSMQGWAKFELILTTISLFNSNKGHNVTEEDNSVVPEYTTNNFEISFNFTLKFQNIKCDSTLVAINP